jgi:hypothetical protein
MCKDFLNFVCKILVITPPHYNKISLISQIIFKISSYSGIVGNLFDIVQDNSSQID